MHRYLKKHRSLGPRGTALAVAMLVIVMLSAVGAIAVDAASYDMTSTGLVSEVHHADGIAEGVMALGRCKACQNVDGLALAMQSMRERLGKAPEFQIDRTVLEAGLDSGATPFTLPAAAGERGSFGALHDTNRPARAELMEIRLDRPRDSEPLSGYSMREAGGSDSASLCFVTYRMTSTGVYMPARAEADPVYEGARAVQRAYLVTGPTECAN